MPLSEIRKPIVLSFLNENGQPESLTFKRPTTRERMDGLAAFSEKRGALENIDAGEREELYLGIAADFLIDAQVQFTRGDETTVNIMEIEGWKQLLIADAFYAPYFEKFVSQFFRLTVAE